MAAHTVPARRTTQPSPFGAPPLFPGEDAAAYDDLLARFRAAIKPKDVLEEMSLRDVVDLTWEILRMRRLRVRFLTCGMLEELSQILEPLVEDESSGDEPSADEAEGDNELSAAKLAEEWAARDPRAIEEVDKQLASKGLTLENVAAQALSAQIESFERIDRMIMNAEARRNAAWRELERHRTAPAQALRQASDDVIEADFEDVARDRRRLKDKA
jgi:hypothetical protein